MPKEFYREAGLKLPEPQELPTIAYAVPPIGKQFKDMSAVLEWCAGEVLRFDAENQKLRGMYEELRARFEAGQAPRTAIRVISSKGHGPMPNGDVSTFEGAGPSDGAL